MKLQLNNVTLTITDCVDIEGALQSLYHCKNSVDFKEVKLLTHFEHNDPHIVKINKISSIPDYSEFMIKKLADYFTTDFVLVAQWDGFIWKPKLWSDEFLEYDYIGAPWFPEMLKYGVPKHFLVGNGGFSLRSKRLQDFMRDDPNIILHEAEDVAICQLNRPYLEKCGFKFAPWHVAYRFSWETGEMPINGTFGAHAILRLIPPEEIYDR